MCSVVSDSFVIPRTIAHQTPLSWDFPARILEWVAISSSRGYPDLDIKPESPALAGRFFSTEAPGKSGNNFYLLIKALCLEGGGFHSLPFVFTSGVPKFIISRI